MTDAASNASRPMTLPGFSIRPETSGDHAAIDVVATSAFGSQALAKLVRDIRCSPQYDPRLALLAEIDDDHSDTGRRVIGHVMISGCTVQHDTGDITATWMLSPLAVVPDAQKRGVGAALVTESLRRAQQADVGAVLLEGDPAFYGRFGFEAASDYGITLPLPEWAPLEAGQIRWLGPPDPSLRGRVVYPSAFDGL